MQRLEVATDVFAEPETVYELLLDFTGYPQYSEVLDDVTRHGEGGPGTEYELGGSWWRLSHTVRSEVTDVEPPRRIDWRLVSDLAARGAWEIESIPAPVGDVAPPAADAPVTRVRFLASYDLDSVDAGTLGLSTLLPADRIVERAIPMLRREATDVVERIVADLEGDPRSVDLDVRRVDGASRGRS